MTASNKVTTLSVHRNTRDKRERRIVKQRAAELARDIPADADGVVTVWFRHNEGGAASVHAGWHVRNALDTHRLPDLCKTELLVQIGRSSGGED